MKKIILMLLLIAQSCVFAFENSYDETLVKLEDGIRNTDVAVVRECLNEIHVREVDMPRMLEFAQGIIDLRRIDVQAITDPQGKYSETPPSVNLKLHVGLCIGSFIAGLTVVPLTLILTQDHYRRRDQEAITIAAGTTAAILIMHGIYKIFNINTRIRNAILKRYVDALSIKQLLYKVQIKE